MTAVVVGANGFLGRHLILNLLGKGIKPVAVVHHRSDQIPDGVEIISVSRISEIKTPVETVYFAAGSYDQPFAEIYRSQVVLLKKISEMFPAAVLVYTSSVAVYGRYRGTVKEDSPFNQPDLYGMAKLAGEFVAAGHPQHRIVRLASLYGVGVKPDLFIAAIVRDARTKKTITLAGKGERIRNFIHVRDAAELMVRAAQSPYSGVLLGTGRKSYTLREFAEMVAEKVPGTKIVYRGTDNHLPYRMDNNATRRKLGWVESVTMKAGLEEMVSASI